MLHITFSRWKNERKFLHITFFFTRFFSFPSTQSSTGLLPSFHRLLPCLSPSPPSQAFPSSSSYTQTRFTAQGDSRTYRATLSQSSTFKHQRRVSVSFFNLVIFPCPLSLSYTRGFPWTSNQKIKSISLSFFPLALHHFLSLTVSKPW